MAGEGGDGEVEGGGEGGKGEGGGKSGGGGSVDVQMVMDARKDEGR